MPEYKYDPAKPGITAELFEQHHRNAQRPGAGFTHPPDHQERAGERGREAQTAWYDDALFSVADHIAVYFFQAGADGSAEPSYQNYPDKGSLNRTIAQGFIKLDKDGKPKINKGGKTAQMSAGTVKQMLRRYRRDYPGRLDFLIKERLAILRAAYAEAKEAERQRKGPQMPQQHPPTDSEVDIIAALIVQKLGR